MDSLYVNNNQKCNNNNNNNNINNNNNNNNNSNVTYIDSFGVENIPKEIKKNSSKQKYHNKYLKNATI